eukprot:Lithocolla_globosa_v1_NODE_2092_length_2174_cov_3.586126.p2 type:complete len:113 gc:universal NODE_2092_length_2174_cov_3.586126:1887-1549(-)
MVKNQHGRVVLNIKFHVLYFFSPRISQTFYNTGFHRKDVRPINYLCLVNVRNDPFSIKSKEMSQLKNVTFILSLKNVRNQPISIKRKKMNQLKKMSFIRPFFLVHIKVILLM